MDSVDSPPQPDAPWTWIHRRGDHDHDGPVGLENLLISIWSPYARFVSKWYPEHQELQARLKHSDQAVQKVIQGNEEDMGSAAPSPTTTTTKTGVSILKSLAGEICEMEDLRDDSDAVTSPSSVFAGEVLSLMDSVVQNLNDTFIFLAEDNPTILHVKEEQVQDIEERLIVFRNFLSLIPNRLLISDEYYVNMFDTAQHMALVSQRLFYVVVCNIINGVEELAMELGERLQVMVDNLDNIIVGFICDEDLESLLVDDDDGDNPTMDEKALEFVNYLIHKLKLMMLSCNEDMKDPFDILIDELSFLRCNLMEDLLLLNKNPIIKEMKSLTISTRALISGRDLSSACLVILNRSMSKWWSIAVQKFLICLELLMISSKKLVIYSITAFFPAGSPGNPPIPPARSMCWYMSISSSTKWNNCCILRPIHLMHWSGIWKMYMNNWCP